MQVIEISLRDALRAKSIIEDCDFPVRWTSTNQFVVKGDEDTQDDLYATLSTHEIEYSII